MNEVDAWYSFRRRLETERARSLLLEGGNHDPIEALASLASAVAIGLMLDGQGL